MQDSCHNVLGRGMSPQMAARHVRTACDAHCDLWPAMGFPLLSWQIVCTALHLRAGSRTSWHHGSALVCRCATQLALGWICCSPRQGVQLCSGTELLLTPLHIAAEPCSEEGAHLCTCTGMHPSAHASALHVCTAPQNRARQFMCGAPMQQVALSSVCTSSDVSVQRRRSGAGVRFLQLQ